jgi:class 3 adenylate cyclase
VRELSHVMERVTLLHVETEVDVQTLERLALLPSSPVIAATQEPDAQRTSLPAEAERLQQALIQTGGNVLRAARLLGLSRDTMRYRMRRYGIERPSWDMLAPAPVADLRLWRAQSRSRANKGSAEQQGTTGQASPGETPLQVSCWERKPVALLAVEVTWPDPTPLQQTAYETRTVAARWEKAIVEKMQGFGGVVLQRAPSLLTVAFGMPQTLEQLPQRAVQAALALSQSVAQAMATGRHEPCPRVRQALHWGHLLVNAGVSAAMERLSAVGETLAWPVRLLGHAAPGEILTSAPLGRLVEGWCELKAREVSVGEGALDRICVYTVVGLAPQ